VCERIISINGGPDHVDFNDKFVAVSKNGDVGCAQVRGRVGGGPKLTYITPDGFNEYTGTNVIES